MTNDAPKLPDNFEEAERFQRLFVAPMVEAVRTEVNSHMTEIKGLIAPAIALEGRVRKLEGNQKRALLGWSVYATAIGIACTAAWRWIASKIHFG